MLQLAWYFFLFFHAVHRLGLNLGHGVVHLNGSTRFDHILKDIYEFALEEKMHCVTDIINPPKDKDRSI